MAFINVRYHTSLCPKRYFILFTFGMEFVRPRDVFWLSFNYRGLSGHDGRGGWIYKDVKEVYDACGTELQDQNILRDGEGNYSGEVGCVLFPDTFTLLEKLQPREWANTI